ncbi:MAG: general stress protein [Pseudoxanthomonas suwonensis]|nr:MAG: general stress protein [Pseudoxanthomonas suwonensis]
MSIDKNELKQGFWKALDSDRTVMLGTTRVHARPMTGLIENGNGPVWFFTADDNAIVQSFKRGGKPEVAVFTFASKDHQLFATVGGTLVVDNDPAVIDRLWNPFVAAWYEGGKDDPKLRLLRFDADAAEIWMNANSLFAGIKMLVGIDPKSDYRDHTAMVKLGSARRKKTSG